MFFALLETACNEASTNFHNHGRQRSTNAVVTRLVTPCPYVSPCTTLKAYSQMNSKQNDDLLKMNSSFPQDQTNKMVIPSSCSKQQQSQPQSRMWISFGIYEPQNGCDIHEAVAHMARVAALLEKRNNIDVAILKSLEHSWAAVFAVWKGGSSGDGPALNLPEAAAFTKGMQCAVRIVDSGWFRLSSQEISRDVPFAQLSLGDIVSLRRIYMPSWKIQDALSYCCLAILKSYFSWLKGLLSYSFYDSLDGKQIIGLGVWDSVESASVLTNNDDNPNANPWVAFWKSLGAKKLKYHVCQVVYVTYRSPCSLQNSRPGFQI